jgi:hypothetical protein
LRTSLGLHCFPQHTTSSNPKLHYLGVALSQNHLVCHMTISFSKVTWNGQGVPWILTQSSAIEQSVNHMNYIGQKKYNEWRTCHTALQQKKLCNKKMQCIWKTRQIYNKKSTSLDQKIRNRDQWHHFNMHNTNGKLAATSMKSFEASTFLSPFIFTRKKRLGKGVRHIPRVMHAWSIFFFKFSLYLKDHTRVSISIWDIEHIQLVF